MKPKSMSVRLDKRGAVMAVLAVILVCLYQAMFFLAPEVLAQPLWAGSALTLAFLFGNLSLGVPVAFAWWMIRTDVADSETHDVSGH